jgi:ATP-dependent DNA helicase DinG
MSTQDLEEEELVGLTSEDVLSVLDAEGPVARAFKGYTPRHEQKQMMGNVLDAFNSSHIALIEAGTGTGKSLAYLIPAMLWAIHTKERTVISTNTITLQEQLLHKDIPLVSKALNIDIKAVLVKGMHNYLCKRKLNECLQETLLLPTPEVEELQKIDQWNNSTRDGSRSSMPFSCSATTWDKVAAESDTCNRNSCDHYQECHFFKARRHASDAQILVVNHHLLFADVVMRSDEDKNAGILPSYTRLIIDEAHNIEDVATEYFASKVSQIEIIRLLARLNSEKGGKAYGKLPLIRERLLNNFRNEMPKNVTSIHNRLNLDLPAMRRDILQLMHQMFSCFFEFTHLMKTPQHSEEDSSAENKLRILSPHQSHQYWNEQIIPSAKILIESIKKYTQSLSSLETDLKQLNHPKLDEQIKGLIFEVNALCVRLQNCCSIIGHFTSQPLPPNKVRWIEMQTYKTMVNTLLADVDLDIAKILAETLFKKMSTVVLCSATLTTNKEFQFARNRLGLTPALLKKSKVNEFIYESPFNFSKQALLAIPNDLPNPSDPAFIQAATEQIWYYLQASRGNAFVLFTSYSMLKTCYASLESRLKEARFHPLKQGDGDRIFLLNRFKTTDRSVLFGTDSFWEGVDVAGEALRCVILVKLPFKVPSEPIIQARSEAIQAAGGDPFMEYSLPQAIVKFKQGFGRLIRKHSDRGCIICLDNRITTKRYGKLFLNSLPNCEQVFASGKEICEKMTEFYRKTHFLTKI